MSDDTPRTQCRVACIQMSCENLAPEKNIAKARKLVASAAAQGAQIVLLPELMAAGYLLTKDTWETAEPTRGGITETFLAKVTRKHSIYCGCTFLEAAEDGHFYNTFSLYGNGELRGKVRKFRPASFEAFIFSSYPPQQPQQKPTQHEEDCCTEDQEEPNSRETEKKSRRILHALPFPPVPSRSATRKLIRIAAANKIVPHRLPSALTTSLTQPAPHIIDTPLGRFGVSICYESFVTRFGILPNPPQSQLTKIHSVIQSIASSDIDLLLMPFSCPTAKHPGPCSASFNASVDIFLSNLNNIPVTLSKMVRDSSLFPLLRLCPLYQPLYPTA